MFSRKIVSWGVACTTWRGHDEPKLIKSDLNILCFTSNSNFYYYAFCHLLGFRLQIDLVQLIQWIREVVNKSNRINIFHTRILLRMLSMDVLKHKNVSQENHHNRKADWNWHDVVETQDSAKKIFTAAGSTTTIHDSTWISSHQLDTLNVKIFRWVGKRFDMYSHYSRKIHSFDVI